MDLQQPDICEMNHVMQVVRRAFQGETMPFEQNQTTVKREAVFFPQEKVLVVNFAR
jgi:hypothetical protein